MFKTAPVILLLISLNCFGQADSIIEYDSTTTIALLSDETSITRKQLDTGFLIKLSDPDAKLVSFVMVYYFKTDSSEGLQRIPFQENKVYIANNYPRPVFFQDPKSNFITLQSVHFERNGKRYRAKGLFLPIK